MIGTIKNWVAVVVLSFSSYHAAASHLLGQDFTYKLMDSLAGTYHYVVNLTIYEDCFHGNPESNVQDNPVYLAVYNGMGKLISEDLSLYYTSADTMPIAPKGACSQTIETVALCINKKTFIKDYYLPPSNTGYVIVYQRCCRNEATNLVDPTNLGISASVNIPPSATTTYNSSALFSNYPPFVTALNTPLALDFSATDPDNDSLSYELCTAYSGGSPGNVKPIPGPPPFNPLLYTYPLSYANPMSCSVPLAVDPVTGMVTGTPNVDGLYLVTVCCHEWRNGVLINTVRRELEFTVATCPVLAAGEIVTYPNPSTYGLNISSREPINSITVTNILGQAVYSNTFNGTSANQPNAINTVKIDVAQLPKGVYFININGTDVRKFVKP